MSEHGHFKRLGPHGTPSVLGRPNRRQFLSTASLGCASVALTTMMETDRQTIGGELAAMRPRAKNVIWLFMLGGTSHLESFDPKPAVNQYEGKTISESPFGDQVLQSPYYRSNVRDFAGTPRELMAKLYPMQVGFRQHGQSGIAVSDWWPNLAECVDELAIVRSMWTTDNDHAAQLQFHTGRHIFEGFHPTIGAWVHYGLGSLNENLPQFVVLGDPPGDCCGGVGTHGASYLGPEHAGVPLETDRDKPPLPFSASPAGSLSKQTALEHQLLRELNSLAARRYPDDAAARARVKSYELAFRMQASVPDLLDLEPETSETHSLYGTDRDETRAFGRQCLIARRLVEKGVRFVQLYHGGGGGGSWDAHTKLKSNHQTMTTQVDRPIAGLIRDLKRRGLLDETIVVWATEFGRTPGAEKADGRDHHPYGFSVWLAGGGIKPGVVHGATDELGFHAVEHRHYVTDIHATVLHQLGLHPRHMEVAGHKRLEMDFGRPIREITMS